MKLKDYPVNLKPFVFHGVTLAVGGDQAVGDCPFCDKPDHFYVSPETGQWDCKRCGLRGNVASFLNELLIQSDVEGLDDLADERGIPVQMLRVWGVRRSKITGEPIIPAENTAGKVANLYRYSAGKVLSTPGCKLHPFGTFNLKKRHGTLWMCEGPWDGMAWHSLLAGHKINGDRIVRTAKAADALAHTHGVIAVPGAASFDEGWCKHVKGRVVRLLYDHDEAGVKGVAKAIKTLAEANGHAPKSIESLRWVGDLEAGYDVRDLVRDRRSAALRYVLDNLHDADLEAAEAPANVDPIPRDSFAQLCRDYESAIHLSQALRDSLAVMLSCVVSTELPGDQLWIRVIGPPGSGKTTLAEAISASEHTFPVSLQTGFHSGYGTGKKDSSLIPKMDHKTVIIKDADTLLSSSALDRILAELRDIYDGTSRAHYRNRRSNVYDGLRITFILCGTDDLRNLNRSSLGERFLDVEVLGDGDRSPYLDRALTNSYKLLASGMKQSVSLPEKDTVAPTFLKQVTAGYIEHLRNGLADSTIPALLPDVADRIKALGELLGFMRAKVFRESEGLLRRPRVELGTRLVSQFLRLAVCLGIVLQRSTIDDEILRVVRKVGIDTAEGFQFEITRLLYKHQTGLNATQIQTELRIGEGTIRRLLHDMQELEIIQRDLRPNKSGQRGRNQHVWQLTDKIRRLYIVSMV